MLITQSEISAEKWAQKGFERALSIEEYLKDNRRWYTYLFITIFIFRCIRQVNITNCYSWNKTSETSRIFQATAKQKS